MDFSSFNPDSSSIQQQQQQPQQPQQIQEQTQTQTQKPLTIYEKIHNFLVSKSGTIITNAFGMAIGFALKDFISSIVINLFKPLLAFIFSAINLNNYYDLNSIISPQNNALNFGSFITSLITFIMVVISVYLMGLNYQ
jgi:large-conductance mechanosensitive channel